MSFIDELCDYLVKKQLIPSERVTELRCNIRHSIMDSEALEAMSHPDSVPWGQAPWDIPPYDETKYPDMRAWMDSWTLKKETKKEEEDEQDSPNNRRGGLRQNSANRKAIKAPDLNDLLPDIILKDKLLATLFPALATGKWNASPTWEEWCNAIELLFPMDKSALDAKLREMLTSYSPRLKACLFDFIDFYDDERTGLLLPDVFEGYSGPSVSPFKALMADEQTTEFAFGKYNWLFVNRNLLLAYHASLVNNRLRPLFNAYRASIYDGLHEGLPGIIDLIVTQEELCRLFVRTFPWRADDLWRKWYAEDHANAYLEEACIFFEEAAMDPTLRVRGYFREDNPEPELNDDILGKTFYKHVLDPNLEDKNKETILHHAPYGFLPRLLACGADPNHKNRDGNTPIDDAMMFLDQQKLKPGPNISTEDKIYIFGREVDAFFSNQATPDSMSWMHQDKWKLIHLAAYKGSIYLACYAFRRGLYSIRDFLTKSKRTPLHTMCYEFNIDKDFYYFFLKTCVERIGFEGFKELLNFQDINLQTPLHVLCKNAYLCDNSTFIKRMTEKGALPNLQDINGNTPLHLILNLLKLFPRKPRLYINSLLKNGASLDIKNNQGKTPLDIAKEIGPEVTGMLQQ